MANKFDQFLSYCKSPGRSRRNEEAVTGIAVVSRRSLVTSTSVAADAVTAGVLDEYNRKAKTSLWLFFLPIDASP